MRNSSFLNKKTSAGSLIGALAGALASLKFHKENDKPVKKAAKTGMLAAAGYLLGGILENWLRKK
jgi:uncharacterized membrane protein YebE (DUF533 family)